MHPCLPLISGERVSIYFDMVNAHKHWSNLLIFCWDKMHTQVYQFMHYIVALCSKWYVMVGNNLYLIYCLISDWLIKCIGWKANCSYVLIWFTFTQVEFINSAWKWLRWLGALCDRGAYLIMVAFIKEIPLGNEDILHKRFIDIKRFCLPNKSYQMSLIIQKINFHIIFITTSY